MLSLLSPDSATVKVRFKFLALKIYLASGISFTNNLLQYLETTSLNTSFSLQGTEILFTSWVVFSNFKDKFSS